MALYIMNKKTGKYEKSSNQNFKPVQQQVQQPKISPPIQQPQTQQKGINWGGVASNVGNIAKNVVLSPYTIGAKSTASLLQPISGVRNINLPLIGNVNTYQEDARQNIENAFKNKKNPYFAAAGSVAQPAIDIGSQLVGGGAGSKALTGTGRLLQSMKYGTLIGGAYGANQGLSQGESLPQIGIEGLKGGLAGAAGATVLHGLLSGTGKLLNKGANIEPSVLQRINPKTNKMEFQVIKKGELDKFSNLIDTEAR